MGISTIVNLAVNRSTRNRRINVAAMLFAAAPFGAGLVRAFQTGHDMRLLWMALASFVGATAAFAVGKRHTPKLSALLGWSAAAFLIATVLAAMAARLCGAAAAPGIWAVASVFGLCGAVSRILTRIIREGADFVPDTA